MSKTHNSIQCCFTFLLFKYTILEQMSLKISQIKDFSSFSKLEVGENFYTVAAMSLTFFFSFSFLVFFAMGSSNIRTKTLTCIHTLYFTEIQ